MYYAVYDITDNNTRTSVIHILKNHGFVRIQKSVFCGNVANQQKKDLIETIKLVLPKNDSFYLMLSCNRCFGRIVIVGKGFDKEYVADKKSGIVL
jgi:CRISPR-associated endonuclease Cas2